PYRQETRLFSALVEGGGFSSVRKGRQQMCKFGTGKRIVLAAALAAVSACGDPTDWLSPAETNTGMRLNFDVLGDTDIASVQVTITQVDCQTGVPIPGGHTNTVVIDYEDMLIPGANPDLAGMPYDASSGH